MALSDKSLCLFAGTQAELASKLVRITSTTLLDVESRKDIKVKSGLATTIDVGTELQVTSKEDTRHTSDKKFFVKTKELLDIDGGEEGKMKAKKWSMETTEADATTKTKGKFTVASNGSIELKHKDDVRFFAGGTNAIVENMKGGRFMAGKGIALAEVTSGSKVELKKTSVRVEGKSKIDVTATTINISGKVLLG